MHRAFGFQWKLPGVSIRHCSDSERQQTASSLAIIVIDQLHVTKTSQQVRRASHCLTLIRLRATDCLKTFAQNPTSQTFRSFSKLNILVLRSMFDNCNYTSVL